MLTVPPHSLLVLCGPAGCGKSSFARRYFRETEVVSSDRCRAFVADDEANQAISREAFILLRTLVRLRLRLKRLTVVDSTALQLRHRRSMVRLGRFFGASVIAVLFDISAETCKERNRRRGRRVPEDVI
ncbi:MAG: AAA family ATPase, partial [Dehalococcoidia bacterium]